MAICPGCGQDHAEGILTSPVDLTILEKALGVVQDTYDEEPSFSGASDFFFDATAKQTVGMVYESRLSGIELRKAHEYAMVGIIKKIFMVGVVTAHHFSDAVGIPDVHATSGEVEETIASVKRAEELFAQIFEDGSEESVIARIKNLLAASGLTEEHVTVVGIDDLDVSNLAGKREEKEESPGGMYL